MCLRHEKSKDLYHIALSVAKYIAFCVEKYIAQACLYIAIKDARGFAKLQMANGKWQIKGHFVPIVKLQVANGKWQIILVTSRQMPDASFQMPETFAR